MRLGDFKDGFCHGRSPISEANSAENGPPSWALGYDSFRRFSSFSVEFGAVRRVLTSKSDSLMNFASGTQVFSLVQQQKHVFPSK